MKRILVEGERIVVAGISLTLGLVLAAPAQAENCVKATGSGGCLASIQEAVDAAGKNGTVRVYGGTYFETVNISKDGLTLKGVGRDGAVIDPGPYCPPDVKDCKKPDDAGPGITVSAKDVTIENLTVENAAENGIVSEGTGTKLVSVRVVNSGANCIDVQGDDTLVSRGRLHACGARGIMVEGARVEIHDTSVKGAGRKCVQVDGAGAQIEGNWIRGCKEQGIQVTGATPVVHRNWVSATRNEGVSVQCTDACNDGNVTHNYVSDVAGDACFSFRDSAGLPVEHNTGIRCVGAGFRMQGNGMVLSYNRAINNVGAQDEPGFSISGMSNVLERNLATGNRDGFHVQGGSNTLSKNIAIDNLDDGFDVDSAEGTLLDHNFAKGNVAVGFEVSTDASRTMLTGNSAFRNRRGYDFCDAGIDTDPSDNHFGSEAVAPCPTE